MLTSPFFLFVGISPTQAKQFSEAKVAGLMKKIALPSSLTVEPD
jgi:hypothetical protein